jgi:hypothetical protein
MKKLFLMLLALSGSVAAFSQKIDAVKVPQAVKDGLKKSHPAATPAWEWEDKNYEANFKENGKEISCVLNKQGTILETETVITTAALPQPARTYLETHYKGKKVKEVAMIVKANGETSYEVVLPSGELLFDASGNFKTVEKEKKEKD